MEKWSHPHTQASTVETLRAPPEDTKAVMRLIWS